MRNICTAILLLLLTATAFAQRNEIGVLGGGNLSFNPQTNIGTGAVIQGNYGRRLAHIPAVALYAEIPVTGSFKISSNLPNAVQQRDYSTLFVTPGVKIKFFPELPTSFYVVAGGGWAHYRQSSTGFTNTTNVFDYGLGTDFKIAPFLGLRTEVRDYYSGAAAFDTTYFTNRQHNVVFAGGLTLRF